MRIAHQPLRALAWALTAFVLAGSTVPAQAVLLAYEPFEYGDVAVPSEGQYAVGNEDAGTGLLGGQDPVIGPTAFYTGPWIQSGGDSQVVKALPSLSHPSLPAGVGGIQQETIQFSCCSFGRSAREIAGGLGGAAGPDVIYESFLIDFGTQGSDDPTQFGLRGHELWNGGVGDTFRVVSLFLNHFQGVNELTLSVSTLSGTTSMAVGGGGLDLPTLALFNGGTHLVVIKYAFSDISADVVSLYLDPNGPIEPLVPDAQISVATSDLFITHQGAFSGFTFSGSGHVPGAIDEIRWSDTYPELIRHQVPEPTLGALRIVGPALAGGLRLRGRRRARLSAAVPSAQNR